MPPLYQDLCISIEMDNYKPLISFLLVWGHIIAMHKKHSFKQVQEVIIMYRELLFPRWNAKCFHLLTHLVLLDSLLVDRHCLWSPSVDKKNPGSELRFRGGCRC